jgi:hypothetical protein
VAGSVVEKAAGVGQEQRGGGGEAKEGCGVPAHLEVVALQ